MILITGIAGLIGRFTGRVLNSALGWATVLLFGKVAQSRQILLLLVTLGSLAWTAALAGVLVPSVGTFLLAAVPAPEFVDPNWLRLAMLAVAIVLPLVIGVASLFLLEPEHRPTGRAAMPAVLRGYPFALLLATTLVLLSAIALSSKAMSLARRWQDAHVPIVLKPGGYDGLIDELVDGLAAWDLPVIVAPAPRALAIPARILAAVGGPGVRELVPQRLLTLRRPGLRVLVYPSDIAISGVKTSVLRARAAIAIRLPRAPAYLTVSKEAQQVEDRLLAAAARVDAGADAAGIREDLAAVDRRLHELAVPFEEWETLYRQRVQIERDLLARDRQRSSVPNEATGAARPALRTGREAQEATPQPTPAWPEWAAAAVGFGLIALDVLLLTLARVSPPEHPRQERRGASLPRRLVRLGGWGAQRALKRRSGGAISGLPGVGQFAFRAGR